ncbi:MAG: hypothetical protein WBK28_00190 [Minisyncoccia bacterium]
MGKIERMLAAAGALFATGAGSASAQEIPIDPPSTVAGQESLESEGTPELPPGVASEDISFVDTAAEIPPLPSETLSFDPTAPTITMEAPREDTSIVDHFQNEDPLSTAIPGIPGASAGIDASAGIIETSHGEEALGVKIQYEH